MHTKTHFSMEVFCADFSCIPLDISKGFAPILFVCLFVAAAVCWSCCFVRPFIVSLVSAKVKYICLCIYFSVYVSLWPGIYKQHGVGRNQVPVHVLGRPVVGPPWPEGHCQCSFIVSVREITLQDRPHAVEQELSLLKITLAEKDSSTHIHAQRRLAAW